MLKVNVVHQHVLKKKGNVEFFKDDYYIFFSLFFFVHKCSKSFYLCSVVEALWSQSSYKSWRDKSRTYHTPHAVCMTFNCDRGVFPVASCAVSPFPLRAPSSLLPSPDKSRWVDVLSQKPVNVFTSLWLLFIGRWHGHEFRAKAKLILLSKA